MKICSVTPNIRFLLKQKHCFVELTLSLLTKNHLHSGLLDRRSAFRLNRFPSRAIYFCFHQIQTHATHLISSTSIPFVSGTSGKIRLASNDAGVKVTLRSICDIGQILPSSKDPHIDEKSLVLTYSFSC